jgi:enediyne biosynthesis protein E4
MTNIQRAGLSAILALACGSAWAQPGDSEPKKVLFPDPDVGVATLAIRAQVQKRAADAVQAPHDFSFADKIVESGITFLHHTTDDNGVAMKAVHYDHANGVLAADVDGDELVDLYFMTQLGGNELWKNRGDGTFTNITESAGVAVADRVSVAGGFADIDNDGDEDLFVTTVRQGNLFFRNDGEGHFTDETAAVGLGYVGHSSGVVFFDYDLDGSLDLFVTNVGSYTIDEQGRGPYWVGRTDAFEGHKFPERTETSILYHNEDGKMVDVSKQMGLVDPGWNGDATSVDWNGDRYPDLYVLNMQGGDRYWVNEGGERFVDQTAEHFPRTPWGAMGVKVFDFDGDGDMDLYVTDMHSDMIEHIGPEREFLKARIPQDDPSRFVAGNAFYQNLGDGSFREISDQIGVENYWPWGVSVDDLNADGYPDLFVTSSMSYPFRYGINSLLLNESGKRFAQAEFILGVEPRKNGATHVPWFQLDCSGNDAGHYRCEGETGRIEIEGTLGTRSSAIFDLDGDGDLDIVTNEFGAAPQVLVSDLAQKSDVSYLQVRLVGTASNRDGLGAVVRVVAGGRQQVQRHDGKSGYLSHSALPLYFGFSGAQQVESVEVDWPSGRHQRITQGIPMRGTLVVTEPTED